MTSDPLLERVLRVVAQTAGPARTPPVASADTPLRAGGFWLDSIDLVELIVACEAEFSVVFEGDVDLTEDALSTARSLADLIRAKGGA